MNFVCIFIVSCVAYFGLSFGWVDSFFLWSIGELPKWYEKITNMVSSTLLSIMASCVFYYFIVYLPERKQIESLNKIINSAINSIYHQAAGVAWVLVSTHQMREQGMDINMGEEFIREWCEKTDVTLREHKQVPELIYNHWYSAQISAKKLSDIITRNMSLADHRLLDHLNAIEETNFDAVLRWAAHPQALVVVQERIIDIHHKAEALKKYYESTGGAIHD